MEPLLHVCVQVMDPEDAVLIEYELCFVKQEFEPDKTSCYPINFTDPYIHNMIIGALPLGSLPQLPQSQPSQPTSHKDHAIQTYRQKRSRRCYTFKPLYPNRSQFAQTRPRKKGRFIKMSAELS